VKRPAVQLGCLLAAAVVATPLAACQSTQDKSAEIAASLGPVSVEKGLSIKKESKVVNVVDTAMITDKNGTAAVVTLENTSEDQLVNVPILIEVLDKAGKSIYSNDIPGIETALAYVPVIGPGETMDWVHNQILPAGEPADLEVKVGETESKLDGPLPDFEVGNTTYEQDPVSGINAVGTAVNNTGEVHKRLLFYGVVRQGDEVIAAGRAAIEDMKPDRQKTFHIFFIGDPEQGDLSVTWFPTLEAK
jgi:hypothetical protein